MKLSEMKTTVLSQNPHKTSNIMFDSRDVSFKVSTIENETKVVKGTITGNETRLANMAA